MSTLYRAQILLEPEQHRILKEIAQAEGQSLSQVVRGIVRHYLTGQEAELRQRRALQAIDNLARIRKSIREQHGVYEGDLLAEIRADREEDTSRVWRGEE